MYKIKFDVYDSVIYDPDFLEQPIDMTHACNTYVAHILTKKHGYTKIADNEYCSNSNDLSACIEVLEELLRNNSQSDYIKNIHILSD